MFIKISLARDGCAHLQSQYLVGRLSTFKASLLCNVVEASQDCMVRSPSQMQIQNNRFKGGHAGIYIPAIQALRWQRLHCHLTQAWAKKPVAGQPELRKNTLSQKHIIYRFVCTKN